MKSSLIVWGIIMLIVFSGAHWLLANKLLAEAWIWVILAIILVVANFLLGRTMKKMPKGTETMWMALNVFGFITTLAVAVGVVPVPLWWLMSLWLLLMGGAVAIGGHVGNNALNMFMGLIMLFASVFVSGFGNSYLFAGSLFFGFLAVVHGYFFGEE
ncbi:MAG: hypothetical protein HY514_03975 [Candidatus Aenigmarchaeota archaeon]|nr:hypothetical protein [Candidatus Aenigmarchaeota archaeon]